jgi:membrane protease YdiL (CAAX protease family)
MMAAAPGAWTVLRLLLVASYRRGRNRWRRQQQLFQQRAGSKPRNWAGIGFVFFLAFMAMLHGITAFLVREAVVDGQRYAAETHGRMVVEQSFIDHLSHSPGFASGTSRARSGTGRGFAVEADRLTKTFGGDKAAVEARLRQSVRENGTSRLLAIETAAPGLPGLTDARGFPPLLGSLPLFAWFIMMMFQGEGLELDIQRRRHPMWEWLFSHPVRPGAVFLAEMLTPIASNPIYITAPVFAGFVYSFEYGNAAGWVAALAVGVPMMVAAACLGRALEVAVTLRFPPRTRGAMIGLMGWAGYATMIGLFATALTMGHVFTLLAAPLAPLAALPWPFLALFLGALPGQPPSLLLGLLFCWVFAGLAISASVAFTIWGAQKGLASNPGADSGPSARGRGGVSFGKNALFRKELLWFARDRSALVQALLIPLTLAGFQLFNMRGVVVRATQSWNLLSGAAIVFGTYFLLVLGPRSLASEGAALWISLTWPKGLESLLRAKALLWSLIATALVAPVLVYAAIQFPGSAWKVGLVSVAWFLFARSMAAKTVTLATVTSESGEIQKVPAGRRWAAQLGLLTFSIGVLTEQWNLMVVGVLYSTMTAAALWQNFRARLPYLYDPWSEVLPRPPTLMHAMIAISVMVEAGATLTGVGLAFLPRSQVAVAQAVVYGLLATVVSLVVLRFLAARGVKLADIVVWRPFPQQTFGSSASAGARMPGLAVSLFAAIITGLLLAAIATLYLDLMQRVPSIAEAMRQARMQMASIPHLRVSVFVMAVFIAPFAEEFLFRGLLFRALDEEWGGWAAVLGSAAFFASYHPVLSWLPVGLLGAANALMFKKTGRLAPAIVVHMVYNAIVLA